MILLIMLIQLGVTAVMVVYIIYNFLSNWYINGWTDKHSPDIERFILVDYWYDDFYDIWFGDCLATFVLNYLFQILLFDLHL